MTKLITLDEACELAKQTLEKAEQARREHAILESQPMIEADNELRLEGVEEIAEWLEEEGNKLLRNSGDLPHVNFIISCAQKILEEAKARWERSK
jgi:hypothetical protein